MQKASILISDVSGIVFDFTFIYEKPVIVIENEVTREGFEAQDVKLDIWEHKILAKVATIVRYKEIDSLAEIIETTINNGVSNKMIDIRNESVFNLGKAGEIAALQLIELIQENER